MRDHAACHSPADRLACHLFSRCVSWGLFHILFPEVFFSPLRLFHGVQLARCVRVNGHWTAASLLYVCLSDSAVNSSSSSTLEEQKEEEGFFFLHRTVSCSGNTLGSGYYQNDTEGRRERRRSSSKTVYFKGASRDYIGELSTAPACYIGCLFRMVRLILVRWDFLPVLQKRQGSCTQASCSTRSIDWRTNVGSRYQFHLSPGFLT